MRMDDTTQTVRLLGALAYGAVPLPPAVNIGGTWFKVARQDHGCQLAPVPPSSLLRRVLSRIEQLLIPRRDTSARTLNYNQLLNRTVASLPSTPSPAEHVDWQRMPQRKLTRQQLDIALAAGQKDFRNIWLQGQDLRGINLREVDLRGSDLRYANLNNADLSNADLRTATFSCANLQGANLSGANLCFSNLNNARLDGVNFTEANLKHATLRDTTLRGIQVAGANFDNVQFSALQTELQPADFTGVRCLSPKLDYLDNPERRNEFLVHFTPAQPSLQRQINRHPDPAVRLSLMRQLVEKLHQLSARGASLAGLYPYFLDVLLDPLYLQDAVIRAFSQRCIAGLIEQASDHVLAAELDDALLLTLQMHLLAELEQAPDYALQHSAAIMQTLFISAHPSRSDNVRCMLPQLQAAYERCLPPSLQVQLASWRETVDEDAFAVCSEDGQHVLLLTPDYFDHLILGRTLPGPKTRMAWCEAGLLSQTGAHGTFAAAVPINLPSQDFQPFPWLLQAFLSGAGMVSLSMLLETMAWQEFTPALQQAMQQLHYTGPKLIEPAQQIRLEQLLAGWAHPDHLQLDEPQLQQILTAFPWQMEAQDQAYLLIALARFFTTLASTHYLGTEWESPRALRYLAVALLTTAHQLASHILPALVLHNWRNRLLGENHAFTCASVVSGMMGSHLAALPSTPARSWIDREACPKAWR